MDNDTRGEEARRVMLAYTYGSQNVFLLNTEQLHVLYSQMDHEVLAQALERMQDQEPPPIHTSTPLPLGFASLSSPPPSSPLSSSTSSSPLTPRRRVRLRFPSGHDLPSSSSNASNLSPPLSPAPAVSPRQRPPLPLSTTPVDTVRGGRGTGRRQQRRGRARSTSVPEDNNGASIVFALTKDVTTMTSEVTSVNDVGDDTTTIEELQSQMDLMMSTLCSAPCDMTDISQVVQWCVQIISTPLTHGPTHNIDENVLRHQWVWDHEVVRDIVNNFTTRYSELVKFITLAQHHSFISMWTMDHTAIIRNKRRGGASTQNGVGETTGGVVAAQRRPLNANNHHAGDDAMLLETSLADHSPRTSTAGRHRFDPAAAEVVSSVGSSIQLSRTRQIRAFAIALMHARDTLLNISGFSSLIQSNLTKYILPYGETTVFPHALMVPLKHELPLEKDMYILTHILHFVARHNLRRTADGTVMRELCYHGRPTNFWLPWLTPTQPNEDPIRSNNDGDNDGANGSDFFQQTRPRRGGEGGDTSDNQDLNPFEIDMPPADSHVSNIIHHVGLDPALLMKYHQMALRELLEKNPLGGQFPFLVVSRTFVGTANGVYNTKSDTLIPFENLPPESPACSVFVADSFREEWKHISSAASPQHSAARRATTSNRIPFPGPKYYEEACKRLGKTMEDFEQVWNDNVWMHEIWAIPTPNWDKIFLTQKLSFVDIMMIEVLIGRMRLHVHSMDSWDVVLTVIGLAGTGKSTVADIFEKMWAPGSLGSLETNVKDFDIYPLMIKNMIMSREFKGLGSLPATIFQKMTSGEPIQLPRKNLSPVTCIAPSMALFGNSLDRMQSEGGALERRVACIPFSHLVDVHKTDGRLKQHIQEKELLPLIVKCSKMYLALIHHFPNRDFWSLGFLVQTFATERLLIQASMNPVLAFIKDGTYVVPVPSKFPLATLNEDRPPEEEDVGVVDYVTEQNFKKWYRTWCQNVGRSGVRDYSPQNFISALAAVKASTSQLDIAGGKTITIIQGLRSVSESVTINPGSEFDTTDRNTAQGRSHHTSQR